MKTTLDYLQKQLNVACHNLFCYSKNYLMDTPKEGYEERFAEARENIEIVQRLIEKETAEPVIADSVILNLIYESLKTLQIIRVTRRGIKWKGEYIYPPEIMEHFGSKVLIVGNAVFYDGKVIYLLED